MSAREARQRAKENEPQSHAYEQILEDIEKAVNKGETYCYSYVVELEAQEAEKLEHAGYELTFKPMEDPYDYSYYKIEW